MRTADALRTLTLVTGPQQGLVTTAQACQVGIDRTTLTRLTASDALTRIRHGVYALPGSEHDLHQDLRAAWLSTDPRRFSDDRAYDTASPVVSHVSATALHGIGELIPDRYSFTVPTRKQTRQPDIHYHQAPLGDHDVTVVAGITVTTAVRTVADLAADHADIEHLAAVARDAVGTAQADLETVATALSPYASIYGCADGDDLVEALLTIAGPPPVAVQTLQNAPSALIAHLVLNEETSRRLQKAAAAALATISTDTQGLAQHVAATLPSIMPPSAKLSTRQVADIIRLLGRPRQAATITSPDTGRTAEEASADE